MANSRKTITLGIALAVAVLATVASATWVTVPLFVLAAFLIAWAASAMATFTNARRRAISGTPRTF